MTVIQRLNRPGDPIPAPEFTYQDLREAQQGIWLAWSVSASRYWVSHNFCAFDFELHTKIRGQFSKIARGRVDITSNGNASIKHSVGNEIGLE